MGEIVKSFPRLTPEAQALLLDFWHLDETATVDHAIILSVLRGTYVEGDERKLKLPPPPAAGSDSLSQSRKSTFVDVGEYLQTGAFGRFCFL